MLISSKSVSVVSAISFLALSSFDAISGHGYLKTPRSRNFVAAQDGVSSGGGISDPAPEYCPQCLNRGGVVAACGKINDHNYDFPPNAVGGVMPPNVQGTTTKGGIIDVEVILTAHHKGHFSFYACSVNEGEVPTNDCFQANPLEFVEDMLYGAPQDPDHKDRAYIPPLTYNGIINDTSGSVPGSLYHYKMKLPDNIEGGLVLLQWHYLSANSCVHDGYAGYSFPSEWGDTKYSHLPMCGPIPEDGDGVPEQFWNCAELTVSGDGSPNPAPTTPSPAPPTLVPAPTTTAPVPVTPVPTSMAPVAPTAPVVSEGDSRMIAYVGNWQSCPTAAQLAEYTHIVIAFAVSYTWSPGKNNCSPTCEIATPPICNNSPNDALLDELRARGKKIIVSFGGAGMGGSWAGDQNDCWEQCYGRESQVVDRLTEIVDELGADGIDIDYEYFYEDNQNGSGFAKGTEAQNFLTQITVGLRNSLAPDAIVTHAPMDVDLKPETAYFQLLKSVSSSLDFIMPQYYNGVTRPALDGVGGADVGSMSALDHYTTVANEFFGGDATKMVFGFCISDCSGTSSNAPSNAAAQVMTDLSSSYGCNGGAFFWVAEHDREGSWSSVVNQAIASTSTCSDSAPAPITPAPTTAPVSNPTKTPTAVAPVTPSPTKAPTTTAPVTPSPTKAPTTPAPSTTEPTKTPSTSAPTSSPGGLTESSSSRCGVSELDARGNCGVECSTSADCGMGEYCWNVNTNYCGTRPNFAVCEDLTQANANSRCGSSELDARELCGMPCTTALDCGISGEICLPVHPNTCDCVANAATRRSLRGFFF